MAPIAENDEFWRKLYNIWLKTSEKNYEEIKLGLFRTDYMLERDENGIETPFLVEFNTIASGAGALCCGVTDMHHALNIKPFNVTNSKLSFELKTDKKARNLYLLSFWMKTLASNIKIMLLIMFLLLVSWMESNRKS